MRTTNRVLILQQFEAMALEATEVLRHLLRDPNTPHSVRLDVARLILTICVIGGDNDEPEEKSPGGPRLVQNRTGSKPDHAA